MVLQEDTSAEAAADDEDVDAELQALSEVRLLSYYAQNEQDTLLQLLPL